MTESIQSNVDRRPIPDPTELTTAQLYREIAALTRIMETRMEGYDKAIELLQAFADRMPTTAMVQASLDGLKAVMEERFISTKMQFEQRDVAVAAALQAAKEAVLEQNRSSATAISKSELATQKQIDTQSSLISTATGALRDQIDDLKARLIRVEEGSTVQKETKTDNRQNIGMLVGVGGLAIAAVVFIMKLSGSSEPQIVYVPSAPGMPPVTAAPQGGIVP